MAAWIIACASTIAAIGVILKVFVPIVRLAVDLERIYPVLSMIAAQFRNDSGSTLRDSVDWIMQAAKDNREAAAVLAVAVETTKQLAQLDRDQLRRLELALDRVSVKVDSGGATGLRIEEAAAGVAVDLADSHDRAAAVDYDAEPGAAADAAATLQPPTSTT